jgi:hypothetical protein
MSLRYRPKDPWHHGADPWRASTSTLPTASPVEEPRAFFAPSSATLVFEQLVGRVGKAFRLANADLFRMECHDYAVEVAELAALLRGFGRRVKPHLHKTKDSDALLDLLAMLALPRGAPLEAAAPIRALQGAPLGVAAHKGPHVSVDFSSTNLLAAKAGVDVEGELQFAAAGGNPSDYDYDHDCGGKFPDDAAFAGRVSAGSCCTASCTEDQFWFSLPLGGEWVPLDVDSRRTGAPLRTRVAVSTINAATHHNVTLPAGSILKLTDIDDNEVYVQAYSEIYPGKFAPSSDLEGWATMRPEECDVWRPSSASSLAALEVRARRALARSHVGSLPER